MKKLYLIVFVLIVAFAAKSQTMNEEVVLVQSIYGMEKKDLIAKHMILEKSQMDIFWQLYEEYELERKEIGLKRAANIVSYAGKYEKLTNEDADMLMKASFDVSLGFVNLWAKTYKKMAKSLSPVIAAQFIQAEMFIENMVRQELALDIPLIGEIELKN
jgi:hypothetical protein